MRTGVVLFLEVRPLESVDPFGFFPAFPCRVFFQAMPGRKAFGQLVLLGLHVAMLTPATYRRSRLLRPYVEILS